MENKKIKTILILAAALVAADLLLTLGFLLLSRPEPFRLEAVGLETSSELKKISYKPVAPTLQSYSCFRFTEEQRTILRDFYNQNGTEALTIRVRLAPSKKQLKQLAYADSFPFSFGFVFSDDMDDKKRKISADLTGKVAVRGNLFDQPEGAFDVAFALPKAGISGFEAPAGFFVASALDFILESACVTPVEIGFDYSGEIPYYAFGPNGGSLSFSSVQADFSGGKFVFPVENSFFASMPEIQVKLSGRTEHKSTSESSVRARINFGGEQLFVKNVQAADVLVIPSSALKNPFHSATVTQNQEIVRSLLMRAARADRVRESGFSQTETEVFSPIRTDPGLILGYSPDKWRVYSYEVFEWDRFPGILIFDTRNYDIQDNFFRRLAYYVEKQGFKGRLLSDAELEGKHGYNAHDYSAESLADFFNKADALGFTLNREEEILRKILLVNRILLPSGDKLAAGKGALVSISQSSTDWQRANLFAHEGWHTIFFTDEEFRNFVSAVYYTMDQKSLGFLVDYFRSQPTLGYDTSDDYLMHNEFMAYIMQQRISEVANYFVVRANWGSVMSFTPRLAAYVRQTKGQGFEDVAVILNDFCFDKYGIICGNISLVSR